MKSPNAISPDRETPNVAWSVVNNLIAGMLLYGGFGYLIGLYFDKASVGLAIGAVFGLAAGTVLVIYRLRQLDGGSKPQQEA